MRTWMILLMALSLALFSCKKDDLTLSGEPSVIGAVGNELDFSHAIPGIGSVTAEITAVNNGVSTLETTLEVTNTDLMAVINHIANLYPTHLSVNGNTVTTSGNFRFTTDGIAVVFDDGEELVVCKYNAGVGDTWDLNVDGRKVMHKVTQKSTEDDYAWGFWNIKVVTMEGTNYGLPGFNKVEYISNHRFGPVGIKGYFSDGTTLEATIFSLFENE